MNKCANRVKELVNKDLMRIVGNSRNVMIVIIVVLTICLLIFRYREGEIDYRNSDTLLTIECYDQTPISQHLLCR